MSRKRPEPVQYRILWAIMQDARLQAPSKCVATILLLKFRNHTTGQCNPSFSTIAEMLGRDRRNVIKAINDLKEAGWISWSGTKGGASANTNAFVFNLKACSTSDEVVTPTGDEVVTGDEKGMRGDEVVTPGVTKSPHELSFEPSKNQESSFRNFQKRRTGSSTAGLILVEADSRHGDGWRAYWNSKGIREPIRIHRGRYYSLPSLDPPSAEVA